MKYDAILLTLVILSGCSSVPSKSLEGPRTQHSLRSLRDAGDYHGAMRALHEVMQEWAEYAHQTGSTAEDAAGFEMATTLATVAHKGDADWGDILDDPEIPYEYKTRLIFEILESRMGRGSVWSPNKELIIVPQAGRLGSWGDVNTLLRQAVNVPNN